jgi:hypothetical protein
MDTSSTTLLKTLPDFDDLMRMVDEIREMNILKALLDREIKSAEAMIVRDATNNPKYFIGGKPPSMTYVEAVYKYTGFENELLERRAQLAETTANLEALRIKFDTYKVMLDIWRTLSANERISVT